MKKFAIIVAGGSGSRMNSAIPKQFLSLHKKPIIIHTLEKFLAIENCQIVLVLPENEIETWIQISEKFNLQDSRIITTIGGNTRFQSVKNGLDKINTKEGLVAVHDAVRPLIKTEVIENTFSVASVKCAVVTYVDSKDSIRYIADDNTNKALDRSKVKIIQTPQTFTLELLKKAYIQNEEIFFTDDASVVEHLGNEIFLINGHYENIKITTPEDLAIAEILLKNE